LDGLGKEMIEATLLTDESLVKAVVEGQSAALGTLYDRYGRLVYSLVVNILNDSGEAEEITQEVFLLVWNKADTFQIEHGKVAAWLCSVARHRAIDALRRHGARPEGHSMDWVLAVEEPDISDGSEPVEQMVEDQQRSNRLRQAVATLPPEQRKVLEMAYFGGMTQEEISAQTGEPLGTIKTRIRLSMQKLRNIVALESY
jgi:RNA polymerase sigma-70 factor (ECF subfamily)